MKLQHPQFDARQCQRFVRGNLNRARDQFIRQLDWSTVLVPIKQSIKAIFTSPFALVVNGFSGHAKNLGNRILLQLGIDRNDAARLETVVMEMVDSGGNPPTKKMRSEVEFSYMQFEDFLHEDIALYRQPDHADSEAGRSWQPCT